MAGTGEKKIVTPSLFPFFIGFVSIANFSINPGLENTFRVTDILCLFLAGMAVHRFIIVGLPRRPFIITQLVVLYLGVWMIVGLISKDPNSVYAAGRLSAGTVAALYLTAVWNKGTDWITPLLSGMVFGGVVVTLLALGQALDIHPLFDIAKPAGAKLWWVGDQLRATGIWEHPNGLTHATMIGAAAALGIYVIKQSHGIGLLGLFGFITLGLYAATSTRAGIIIAIFLIVLAFIVIRSATVRITWILSAIVAMVLALFFLQDMLNAGWFDRESDYTFTENLAERIQTGIETLGFAFQRPFGYGFNARVDMLASVFGNKASHNSFLSLAMTFGLPAAALLISGFITAIRRLFSSQGDQLALILVIASTMLSFFFEDVIYSSTFTTLVPILLMLAISATSIVKINGVRVNK